MRNEELVEYDVTLVIEQTISTKVTAPKGAGKDVIEGLAINKWSDGEVDVFNNEVKDINIEKGEAV